MAFDDSATGMRWKRRGALAMVLSRFQSIRSRGLHMKTETIDDAVFETWSVEETATAFERNEIVLIDVRTVQEYSFEHIQGALLLPMHAFDAAKLPGQGEKQIVFHCGSGIRSEKVARACIAAGIRKIAHMEGGFGAWKAAKLPFIGINMGSGAPQLVNG